MTLETALVDQLAATHAGDPWYGPPRAALLSGLTPIQATSRVVPAGHSIWEIVLHMTSWTREVTRRLGGARAALPQEGDWPAVGEISETAWRRARADLDEAHGELLAAIRNLPASRWADPVGTSREPALGTGVTVCAMLIGLAQHDAYHTGQIALLRRSLSAS
jgi:uncharacterized damage-inducible protein DinB